MDNIEKKDATLIKKLVKAGGTFYALKHKARPETLKGNTVLFFIQNSTELLKQEKAAAIKAGFEEDEVLIVKELKKWKTKDFQYKKNYEGKLILINKNETYYPQLAALKIQLDKVKGSQINIIDEYDVEGVGHKDGYEENRKRKEEGKSTNYSLIGESIEDIVGINSGENNEDNLWLISATNSSGAISNLSFKVVELSPWSSNYKGMQEARVGQVSNETMASLLEIAELTGAVREAVLNASITYKLLINTTKRVNGGENEIITHEKIQKACQALGKKAIQVNGNYPYDKKAWDDAEIVIGGSVFDRTFEAREVYTQITAYSATAWYGSVEQQERLSGVKLLDYPTTIILSEDDVKKRKEVMRVNAEITKELLEMDPVERVKNLPEFAEGMNPFPGKKSNGGFMTKRNNKNYRAVAKIPMLESGAPDLDYLLDDNFIVLSEFREDDGTKTGTGLSIRDVAGYGQSCTIDIATGKRSLGEVKLRLAANKINDLGLKEGDRLAKWDKYILGTVEEREERRKILPEGNFIDAQFDKAGNCYYSLYQKKELVGGRHYIPKTS